MRPFAPLLAILLSAPVSAATKADVLTLHPTQMTVGMREVRAKTKKLLSLSPEEAQKQLKKNPIPVVAGPRGRLYIIDHHHLARAALDAGFGQVFVETAADLSALPESGFWDKMKEKAWVYPYDEHGNGPHAPSDLPQDVRGLVDDPFRSVAWQVREDGGYEKTDKPFAEFLWANFFRSNIKTDPAEDFKKAVAEAMEIAKDPRAKDLPGYLGK